MIKCLTFEQDSEFSRNKSKGNTLKKSLENTIALLESPDQVLREVGYRDFISCLHDAPLPDEFVERIYKYIASAKDDYGLGEGVAEHFGKLGPSAPKYAQALVDAYRLKSKDGLSCNGQRPIAVALKSLSHNAQPVVDQVLSILDELRDDYCPWKELIQVVKNCPPYDKDRIRTVFSQLLVRFKDTNDYHKELCYDLCELGDFAIPAILDALSKEPYFFTETLSFMFNATEAFPAMLHYAEIPQTRSNAVQALINSGIINNDVKRLVRKSMTDPECAGDCSIYSALFHRGPYAAFAIPELLTWFTTPYGEPTVCSDCARVATEIVGRMGPIAHQAIPHLTARLLRCEDSKERECAAEALSRMGPDAIDSIPALRQAIERESSSETKISLQLALRELERWCPSPDRFVESDLLVSQFDIGMKLPELCENIRLRYENGQLRWNNYDKIETSVQGLARLGPKAAKAAPELAFMLASFNAPYVMDALSQIGEEAVPSILPFTRHPSEEVQVRAFWTLGRIGAYSEDVLTALRAGLNSPDPCVRWYASWCAKCIPLCAKTLAPELAQAAAKNLEAT